ncbi:MAG: leucine-rich repeat protein, partial [Ruminococcus sp.]|nr:leucine-rich repeat protein [Ruminococcus sp.]
SLPFGKLISSNTMSASAANLSKEYTSGDWKYQYDLNDNSATIIKYIGNSKDVSVPESIDGHYVNCVERWAFENNTTVESVVFPRGVKAVLGSTFRNATNLKSFTISDSITAIYANAFQNTALESIYIPANVKTIKRGAFMDCKKLRYVTLNYGIEEIDMSAFLNSALVSINIPASVKTIGAVAFKNCQNLTSVTISGSPEFGERIFQDCPQLINMNIDPTAFENAIKSNALWCCSNLQYINGESLFYVNPKTGDPYLNGSIREASYRYAAELETGGVGYFNKYLTAYINKKAKDLTKNCKNDMEKIKTLHDWVCNNTVYEYDENGKPDSSLKSHSDSSVFFYGRAVCDGYARAYTLLLRAVGIEAYYTVSSSHAWTMVKLGNHYFHVDTCHDDGNTINYTHFLKTDKQLQLTCSSGHSRWNVYNPDKQEWKGVNGTVYPFPRYFYDDSVTPVCRYPIGDLNMDTHINDKDYELLWDALTRKVTIPGGDLILADVNYDGKIDYNDLFKLFAMI